jgi:hypothetical protein
MKIIKNDKVGKMFHTYYIVIFLWKNKYSASDALNLSLKQVGINYKRVKIIPLPAGMQQRQ